ncbi:hypothetical protein [Companilactobacillus jidongensis]|uniref:hypothetical protein n=1 Tax=Companilactobacillus jidongensis TaxID=2486006 RepID=UPI000F78A83F|nr:hypothetical protein [Companilactobacillus jidongensis]
MHRRVNIYNSKNDIHVVYEPYSKKYLFFKGGRIPYIGITVASISFLILIILSCFIPYYKFGYVPYPDYEPDFLFFNFTYSYNEHFSVMGLFTLLNFAAILQALIWDYSFKLGRHRLPVNEDDIDTTEEINSAIYKLIKAYRLKTVTELKHFIRMENFVLIVIYLCGLLMFYFTYTDNRIYTWDILFLEPYFTMLLFAITFLTYFEVTPKFKLLHTWAHTHSNKKGRILSPSK